MKTSLDLGVPSHHTSPPCGISIFCYFYDTPQFPLMQLRQGNSVLVELFFLTAIGARIGLKFTATFGGMSRTGRGRETYG